MNAKKHHGFLFGASLVLGLMASIAFLASPASATTVTLASGETSAANGQADPLTTVSPGGSGGQAVITTFQPTHSVYGTLTGARWVSISASASTSNTLTYVYRRAFTLPACVQHATLSGQAMADDRATVLLNGTTLATISGYIAPTSFSGVPTGGSNVVEFRVQDTASVATGLDYKVTINFDPCEQGIVKVCKIAGPGVALNTPFTFNAGGQSISVPAGPAAQGGFCKPFPASFNFGNLTVQEVLPPLVQVVNIQGAPPGRLIGQNPAAGTATVNVGSGVTEVTFTDRGPGYMEICKETQPTNTPTQFTFKITPPVGPIQTVIIPGGGACSGPLQVASGTVSVKETVPSGWHMTPQCHTLPVTTPPLLLSCTPGTSTATATVVGGDISTQTLLYFRNVCDAPACIHPPVDSGDVGVPIDLNGGAGIGVIGGDTAEEIIASVKAQAAAAVAAAKAGAGSSASSAAPEDRAEDRAAEVASRNAERQAAIAQRQAERAQRG